MTTRVVDVDSRSAVVAKQAAQERIALRRAPLEETPTGRRSLLLKLLRSMPANDIASQHASILAALRAGTLTTHECRQYLDVVQPTTRIHELRTKGYHIVTQWVRQETAYGRVHRFARYSLVRGQGKGAER